MTTDRCCENGELSFFYMSNYTDWPQGGMLTYIKNIVPDLEEIAQRSGFSVRYYGCAVEGRVSDFDYLPIVNIKKNKKVIPNSIRCFFSMMRHRRLFKNITFAYSHTEACTIALKLLNPKCKVIHHQHGLSYKKCRDIERFHNFERFLAQKMADAVLVVASDDLVYRHALQMGDVDKYQAIGSPIRFDLIEKIRLGNQKRHSGTHFVFSGRLVEHKNVLLALRAFALFEHSAMAHEEDTFTIIGEGPTLDKLKGEAQKLAVQEKARFLGLLSQDEVIRELVNSDVMLFPSKGEGVSLAVLEGLAAGLPVVCCDVVGLNDLIIDGSTGMIAADCSVTSFEAAMERAVAEKETLAGNCIEFASGYASRAIAESIVSFIYRRR